MFYILGLFLIIGLILGGFTDSLPFDLRTAGITGAISNAFNNFRQKVYEFIFPASENEILIENLDSNYDLLDRFFSESSENILKSKNISEGDKKTLRQAIQIFNKTKDQIKTLGKETIKNEPGILESLIKKALNIDGKDGFNKPDPTYIPPACRLECNE